MFLKSGAVLLGLLALALGYGLSREQLQRRAMEVSPRARGLAEKGP